MLLDYKGKLPKLGERVFIAQGAVIVGDVEIGDHSSVWFNSVIRGDVNYIRIGKHTNIQDGSILHVMKDQYPLVLHDYVTVGHGVMLHGCEIASNCLIGMRAETYAYGSPEYVALETFLMWRARGMPLETPAVRP